MKRHIWDTGLAIALAFFALGVVGMVIEAIFHPTQPFWVSFWIAVVGLIASLIIVFRSQIYKAYTYLKSGILLVWSVITHIKESDELLSLKRTQLQNPSNWLCPVIEYVDLNPQGSPHNDNDVYVRFQLDSHLLFPITEFYIFAKLCLAVPDPFHENESGWYEISKPERHAPIEALVRYPFSSAKIHLLGKSDGEKCLLDWMQNFRHGKPVLAMLKVGVTFKKGDSPILLGGNGPKYIAPMNDYRDC